MKKGLLVILNVSLLLGFSFMVSAIIINPTMQFIVQNETYKVNSTMVFNQIIIDSTYIVFNNTGFYVFSQNSITITLVYINDDIIGAVNGEKVLDFYATTTAGTVWFNLSGFPATNEYSIKRNGNPLSTSVANASGFISFKNTVWSTNRFQIFQQAQGSGDSTPPVITQMGVISSNPLDAQAGYGWENFSCTVTDNVAVNQVRCNVTNPDSTKTSYLMTKRGSTTTYYSNRSFQQYGNYSYFIRATDTSNNVALSSNFVFSLPPNWDVNRDGLVTVMDLVLISNHYGGTGPLGWIREDVDNNGKIEVLDMVLASGHFGESWWS